MELVDREGTAEKERERERERERGRQTDRQTDRQTERGRESHYLKDKHLCEIARNCKAKVV